MMRPPFWVTVLAPALKIILATQPRTPAPVHTETGFQKQP